MKQVTLTNYAASFIDEFRNKDTYIQELEDVAEAMGVMAYIMHEWESGIRPDFSKIMMCLEKLRDMSVTMADIQDDGK